MKPNAPCSAVVELRQYRLHPGRRDELIELFEREFVETQEAVGMQLIGQFRDLDDADRFVWLRGFADMPARAAALSAFYGGPVWRAHREAANATMVDSDDVLLLRPAMRHSGFAPAVRGAGADAREGGLVVATLCHFDAPVRDDFLNVFDRQLAPAFAQADAPVLAALTIETSPNNFPALPVREGEHVFVWISAFADEEGHCRFLERASAEPCWRQLRQRLERPPQMLRLAPTARSLLRARAPLASA